MPTVPFVIRPQLGSHVQPVKIQGLTAAADGSLSLFGSPVDLTASRRSLGLSLAVDRSEINSASSRRMNEVVIGVGSSMNVEVFSVNGGLDPQPLLTLWQTLDANNNPLEYFKLTWVAGTATGSIETCSFIGVKGDLDLTMQGRGETVCTFALGPCDPNTSQLTRAIS